MSNSFAANFGLKKEEKKSKGTTSGGNGAYVDRNLYTRIRDHGPPENIPAFTHTHTQLS